MSAAVVLLINILTGVISVHHSVTSTQATSTARLDVYGDSGIFLSPGYPNSYSLNLNLTYTAHLDSSGPLVVGLSMVIDLEKIGDSCYDYVMIGSTVHCGNKTELTVVEVSGNLFTMLFITDGSFNFRGFNITYAVVRETRETQASTSTATDESVASSTDSLTDSFDSSTISSITDPRTDSMATEQNVGSSTDDKETVLDSSSMATVETVGSSTDIMTSSDSSSTSSTTARTENRASDVSVKTSHVEVNKTRSGDISLLVSEVTPVTTDSDGNSIQDITTPVIYYPEEQDKQSSDISVISDLSDQGFTSLSKENTDQQESQATLATFDTLSTRAGDGQNEFVTPGVISTDVVPPPQTSERIPPPANYLSSDKDNQSSDLSGTAIVTHATSGMFLATSHYSDTTTASPSEDEPLSRPTVTYDSRSPPTPPPPSKPLPVLAPCRCQPQQSGDNETADVTSQRAEEQASQLARALAVDKGNVSSQKRRKVSAPNGHLTATTCGVMVTAVCVLPFLLLVVVDIAGSFAHSHSRGNRRDVTA